MKKTVDHAKIKQLRLYTRRLLSNRYSGNVRSAQRGYGLDFDQLRDYTLGDDIRAIDWKSTARANRMMIKEYYHEHIQRIILLLDVSASNMYSSVLYLKQHVLDHIATVLVYAAEYSNAQAGLLLFSDTVEWYQKTGTGVTHLKTLLEKIWNWQPTSQKTSLEKACTFIASQEQGALVVILSDGIDQNYTAALQYMHKRHEVVIIRCLDRHEKKIPQVGLLYCQDPETQTCMMLNTNKKSYSDSLRQRIAAQELLFKKNGIDYFDVFSENDSLDALILFFAKRLVR